MPFYQKQGQLPNKRHIQFRDKDNNLYWEELVSREGFSYIYSNLYHLNPPTKVEMIGKQEDTIGKREETIGTQEETIRKHLEIIGKHKETIGKQEETIGTHEETIGEHAETIRKHKETIG